MQRTTGAAAAGTVGIIGATISLLSVSDVLARTTGTGDAGSIVVDAHADGLGVIGGSEISVSSLSVAAGAGDAGNITIRAVGGQLFVERSDVVSRGRVGAAGTIAIEADFVTALDGVYLERIHRRPVAGAIDIVGSLTIAPDGQVRSGNAINVTGDSLSIFAGRLDGVDLNFAVNSFSMASGSAMGSTSADVNATLTLTGADGGIADRVSISDESFISADTVMTAHDISLGNQASIASRGGSVILNVDRLFLSGGGGIGVGAEGDVDGGSVLIRGASAAAAELVSIRGESQSGTESRINSGAGVNPFINDASTGGPITIVTQTLELTDGGNISSNASSLGSGGNIVIEADIVSISDGGFISSATNAFGDAGSVTIRGASAPGAAIVEVTGGANTGIFTSSSHRNAGGGPQ